MFVCVCVWERGRGVCFVVVAGQHSRRRRCRAKASLSKPRTPTKPQPNQGFAAAGYIALTGDLPGALAAFRADHPVLAVPAKLLVSWPLVYHYLGGARHFVWDLHKIGNNADKTSLLEKERVEQSSKALFAASAVVASILALL